MSLVFVKPQPRSGRWFGDRFDIRDRELEEFRKLNLDAEFQNITKSRLSIGFSRSYSST